MDSSLPDPDTACVYHSGLNFFVDRYTYLLIYATRSAGIDNDFQSRALQSLNSAAYEPIHRLGFNNGTSRVK